ncbi:HAMP domain-containing protein [Actinacidiphila alni]|uniref:histidine kinase n=1 Tax=Actinacidiphila alni TaxID=380248 RepID=A0A1I2LJJ3_9ACTN|nr:ATP-binding protein [Actinacidiphila alni]SFF77271.1 HAMP domain-containing protein [Actinacidiphila alni]
MAARTPAGVVEERGTDSAAVPLPRVGPDSDAGSAPARSRVERWTTGRWLAVVSGVALLVLAALGVVGGWTLAHSSSVTSDMVDHTSPALVNSVRLEMAVINQETGVRGYALSGRRTFLQPYTQGLADEKTALTAIRTAITGDRRAEADLQQMLDRVRDWQRTIAEPVAGASPSAVRSLGPGQVEAGKTSFDRIRKAAATQQDHLRAERSAARQRLSHTTRLRDWIFAATALVILLLAVLAVEGLRRGITSPLLRLSRDTRKVSDGDFGHAIEATGPADLRGLGDDVETMRRRLSQELAASNLAHRLLTEQAEDLQRSNSELEQFAYVASHDLQEPLRKVASFCQLLERRYASELDDRARTYIGFAVDGANRMQTLINDLLAFSRVGRLHNDQVPVDLEQIHDATVDALAVAVEESGAEITRTELPTVTGDTTQFGMLFQNLLSNAIKFRRPDHPPRIHVSAEPDGDFWRFSVTDNGIGIDREFSERVFVIFQRLHTRDTYEGNGIGLAMCKKVVELHGGTIGVDPEHSPGTRVDFTLPAAPAAPPGPATDPAADA